MDVSLRSLYLEGVDVDLAEDVLVFALGSQSGELGGDVLARFAPGGVKVDDQQPAILRGLLCLAGQVCHRFDMCNDIAAHSQWLIKYVRMDVRWVLVTFCDSRFCAGGDE